MFSRLTLVTIFVTYVTAAIIPDKQLQPTCESRIYCRGELLETIQLAHIFPDSKTFVDMNMRFNETVILENFAKFKTENGENPTKEKVEIFVNENFENSTALEDWSPSDNKENLKFFDEISDENVKNFAIKLNGIWKMLGRKIRPEVLANPNRTSFLTVNNGFIIPGGRFKEFYYWDTYWIIDGLLICEMYETAKGMLENFASIVDRYGFIPNGGRVYYLKRSQPPLFVPMVANYYRATGDLEFVKRHINALEKELNFWFENRMIQVGLFKLARYFPESSGPRPESYREDYLTAQQHPEEDRERVYVDLKGAAESGWDFSSRWFYDENGGNTGNVSNIYTRRTLPVDLNSFLYKASKDLSLLYSKINLIKSQMWAAKALKLKLAIQAVFWDETDGVWYDYDLEAKTHRKNFYPTNLTPLWAGAFDKHSKTLSKQILNYLDRNNITSYQGGTPASLLHTGEQWDYPNAWPPAQDILVRGVDNLKTPEAKQEATKLAQTWVRANLIGYQQTGEMFEKYDANTPGGYGGGGEYTVQAGFGWSNGVALRFINDYYRKQIKEAPGA